jgi:hypothetical protein
MIADLTYRCLLRIALQLPICHILPFARVLSVAFIQPPIPSGPSGKWREARPHHVNTTRDMPNRGSPVTPRTFLTILVG